MDIFKTKELVSMLDDPLQIIVLFAISIPLGFLIAWVYQRTHRGFSYSQSFSITLVLLTVITTFIIVIIQDNIARAIGIFGAFSIIRFRTAIKDSRDIAFIFLTLAVGLSIGAQYFQLGITSTILICLLIFIIHKTNFGGLRKLEYVLNFKMDSDKHSNNIFKDTFDKYLKKQALLNVDAKDKGNYMIFTFNVSLKDSNKLDLFINEMNQTDGVYDVSVVSSKSDLEF